MSELWANNAKSTLNSGISAATASLVLADGSGFPSPTGADYCWATLDDGTNIEIVKVTARSGNTLTVTRAQQGTTGTAFSAGTRCQSRLTAETMQDLQSGLAGGGAPNNADYWVETANGGLSAEVVVGTTGISTAAYASRQVAAKAGRLFLPNNGFVIERDTGTAWAPWGPIFPLTPPVDGDFSWINQGGASVATTNGGIFLSGPATAGISVRCRVKAAPATPYTITAAMLPLLAGAGSPLVGLCWREVATGEIIRFGFYQTGGAVPRLQIGKLDSATTFNANYVDQTFSIYGFQPMWLRIADNGTNRICSMSLDGQNWFAVHTIGRTDFLTADQVGFFVEAGDTSYAVGTTLISWEEA